jgi:hypothetical protein
MLLSSFLLHPFKKALRGFFLLKTAAAVFFPVAPDLRECAWQFSFTDLQERA